MFRNFSLSGAATIPEWKSWNLDYCMLVSGAGLVGEFCYTLNIEIYGFSQIIFVLDVEKLYLYASCRGSIVFFFIRCANFQRRWSGNLHDKNIWWLHADLEVFGAVKPINTLLIWKKHTASFRCGLYLPLSSQWKLQKTTSFVSLPETKKARIHHRWSTKHFFFQLDYDAQSDGKNLLRHRELKAFVLLLPSIWNSSTCKVT